MLFVSNFPAYLVLIGLHMSLTPYVSFVDGSCHSTQNLSSVAWVIYDHNGELVYIQGIYLGRATNNIVDYSAVIKLLSKAITLIIR